MIFNWRLYLKFFYNRGMKTLIMIGAAALIVWTFNIDILEKMLASYGLTVSWESSFLPHLLTALILAGGSAGVYKILVALRYREARTPADVELKPKANKAWISVQTIRNAVGPIHVRITEEISPPNPLPQQLAGVVATEGLWRTLSSVFLIDRSRFPLAGGYEVKAATPYRLEITGEMALAKQLMLMLTDSTPSPTAR